MEINKIFNKGMRVEREKNKKKIKIIYSKGNEVDKKRNLGFFSCKGLFFTMDSLFALMIIIAVIPMFLLLSISTVSPEMLHQRLNMQADDAINLLSEAKVIDVIREPVIINYYNKGVLTGDDLNRSLIDAIGNLWALDNVTRIEAAKNITGHLLGRLMPANTNWGLRIENESIYNTSGDIGRTFTISKKIISGYMKEQPTKGYIAKAYLNRINGKRSASYVFFGGFVGEGNITSIVTDIPQNSTMRNIYMEMNVGNNFTLYVNNNSCGNFIKSPGKVAVDNWTITDPACLGRINPGENNTVGLGFAGNNLVLKFIGGGYIKITYDTTEMVTTDTGIVKHYTPGIDGIINLYSSFYSTGTLNAIKAYLHYSNNLSTSIFFNIGNASIYESNATGEQKIFFNNTCINSSLASANLTYAFLSNKTVPIRIATRTGVSFGTQREADIVLITDVSGSMDWRLDNDQEDGTSRSCTDPNLYAPSTKRISLAKCLDNEFIDIILNNSKSRVGLVSYSGLPNGLETYDSTIVRATHNLSNNITSLKNQISAYSPNGATGICGAIRKARTMLEEQSSSQREKFIVVMTDGLANVQCKPPDNNTVGCIPSLCPSSSFCPDGGCGYRGAERSGSNSMPALAFINKWIMIAGNSAGTFKGYDYSNNTWITNDSNANGLVDVGSDSAPALAFNITGDGRWTLIAGEYNGDFNGFYWSGSSWVSNSSLVTGLGDVGYNSAPALAFNITGNNKWILIAGEYNGNFNGFYWSGSQWVSNSSLVSGLRDMDDYAAPALAFDLLPNKWYLISGVEEGSFYTYFWNVNKWTMRCGDLVSIKALNDAIDSACKANNATGATIYTIGFGPLAYCSLAESALRNISACGNGSYYASDNATELKQIYYDIAHSISEIIYQAQTVTVEGIGVNTTLYPDSYIELNYTKPYTPPEYQEISINIDTDKFGSCYGSFFVPSQMSKIEDVKVTSFSGDYWTHNVSINSKNTANLWQSIYLLSAYGNVYTELGDPYVVHIPENLIASNATNNLSVILAIGPTNITSNCSLNNRAIYKAKIRASTFYSDIFPQAWGSNVQVYFDRNHDGFQDGSVNIEIGKDLPNFNPNPIKVGDLDINNNAVDAAFLSLLESLDFVTVPGNYGRAGSEFNPIDIELSEDMTIETLFIGGIPYMWGPVDIGIEAWV